MRFCIVDVGNLFHRTKHGVFKRDRKRVDHAFIEEDNYATGEEIAEIFDSVFLSLRKTFTRFKVDHIVACFDSRSWRREVTESYKATRREAVQTEQQLAERDFVNKAIDEFENFLVNQTNVTVLKEYGMEADDFIARWVQRHPLPHSHVILSADSDLKQLVSDNVDLYNPILHTLYTINGVFFQDGKKPKKGEQIVERFGDKWKIKLDSTTHQPLTFDPEWELFVKCIRGDKSDNIRPAFPRVTTKRMKEAFYGDPIKWNNFINSTWGDENQNSVREIYEYNKLLIDLNSLPEEVIEILDETIDAAIVKKPAPMIGIAFAQFCGKHGLIKLKQAPESHIRVLSASYRDDSGEMSEETEDWYQSATA